jgi:DnaJ-class molecular chaperone
MESLRGYDRWKTTPPAESEEPCSECDGQGFHADEDGRWKCDECDGTGVVQPDEDCEDDERDRYDDQRDDE